MPTEIKVLPIYAKAAWPKDATVISTVARDSELSPFRLGPCPLYGHRVSRNVENGWQYSKVYGIHLTPKGYLSAEYWTWAEAGWASPRAVRYPMGKGIRPEFSFWDGQRLPYVEARKRIYVPLYGRAVRKSPAWRELVGKYRRSSLLILRDYDAYDHAALGMSLTDVLNDPNRKMGHAFVLAMMLRDDPALDETDLEY